MADRLGGENDFTYLNWFNFWLNFWFNFLPYFITLEKDFFFAFYAIPTDMTSNVPLNGIALGRKKRRGKSLFQLILTKL